MITLPILKSIIADMPIVQQWPQLLEAFSYERRILLVDVNLVRFACLGVGGSEAEAQRAGAAYECVELGVLLIDDMLDKDPEGLHHSLGAAATANLAYGLQALGHEVIRRGGHDARRLAALDECLDRLALEGALGQYLDEQNLPGEANYWLVTRYRGGPFFRGALELGARMGGADDEFVHALAEIGLILGDIVIVHDDLMDAFAKPASPDWFQMRNNLLFCYALTAEHERKAEFRELMPRAHEAAALEQAQAILSQCGAASYAYYQMALRATALNRKLQQLKLVNPDPLVNWWRDYIGQIVESLQAGGISISMESFLNATPRSASSAA